MSDDKTREIAALKARLAELEGPTEPSGPLGAPDVKKKPDPIVIGGLAVAGLLAVAFVWIFLSPPAAVPSTAPGVADGFDSPTQRAIAASAAEVRSRQPGGTVPASAWRYSEEADPMTDRLTHLACTSSTNQVRLDRPYEDVYAELCIRQSPKWGLDTFVQLKGDGQILCRTYRDCAVKVRFGDGAQQSFSAADSADGSSNVIFLTNASRFVAGAKGADLTRVELTLYQAGSQIVEFNTKSLEWPRPAPAAVAQ